jgi:hypothetical protein
VCYQLHHTANIKLLRLYTAVAQPQIRVFGVNFALSLCIFSNLFEKKKTLFVLHANFGHNFAWPGCLLQWFNL